jgi:hypothetical protein
VCVRVRACVCARAPRSTRFCTLGGFGRLAIQTNGTKCARVVASLTATHARIGPAGRCSTLTWTFQSRYLWQQTAQRWARVSHQRHCATRFSPQRELRSTLRLRLLEFHLKAVLQCTSQTSWGAYGRMRVPDTGFMLRVTAQCYPSRGSLSYTRTALT